LSDTTPNRPGVLSRVAQAARYVVSGVTPETWFGPMQPLQPMAPAEVKGRAWDYPVGWNLNYVPRASERIGFDRLRALADGYDLLRLVIETRKDQMTALTWSILPRQVKAGERASRAGLDSAIAEISEFLQTPDRRHDWAQWLRGLLEDHFVVDAPAIYRRRTRGGQPYAFELLDGARIKVLLADDGRTPEPPDPAYQQVLKGIPAADYSTDELLYYPKNFRTNHAYGYSPVEQIVSRVETAIARGRSQLAWFTEGNMPDGLITGPEDWTMDQIRAMQTHWDSLFCYAFSVSPQPFVKMMNRATAESAAQTASAEGLSPTMIWVKRLMDRLIAEDFGCPSLEFSWDEDRELDPSKAAEINQIYVRSGVKTIDEVRDDLGLDALGGAAATAMVATATGYVPINGAPAPPAAPSP
jgi:hypothetical protein